MSNTRFAVKQPQIDINNFIQPFLGVLNEIQKKMVELGKTFERNEITIGLAFKPSISMKNFLDRTYLNQSNHEEVSHIVLKVPTTVMQTGKQRMGIADLLRNQYPALDIKHAENQGYAEFHLPLDQLKQLLPNVSKKLG